MRIPVAGLEYSPLKTVGIVGCGDISHAYVKLSKYFGNFVITCCASRSFEAAEAFAQAHGLRAVPLGDMLNGDAAIDIVLNLTPPVAHDDINAAALDAGMHVYSEKPIGSSVARARELLARATSRGLRFAGAPDTFLGAATQAARQLLDNGEIGAPIFGTAAFVSHGMEHRHPNPAFFFRPGGGPVLDIAPYYITSLIALLGPVARVSAMGKAGFDERVVSAPGSARHGERIRVEVLTSVQALLVFTSGAQISLVTSWDSWGHGLPHIEIHGTERTMRLPDPDTFGGDIQLSAAAGWQTLPTGRRAFGAVNWPDTAPGVANYRGLGLADLAAAIGDGRAHRASAELAIHGLDVMTSILAAADRQAWVELSTTCVRPQALSDDEALSWQRR